MLAYLQGGQSEARRAQGLEAAAVLHRGGSALNTMRQPALGCIHNPSDVELLPTYIRWVAACADAQNLQSAGQEEPRLSWVQLSGQRDLLHTVSRQRDSMLARPLQIGLKAGAQLLCSSPGSEGLAPDCSPQCHHQLPARLPPIRCL